MSTAIRSAAFTLLVGFAVVAIAAGCNKDKDEAAASAAGGSGAKPSYFEEGTATATATVESVNPQTRQITLRNEAGESYTLIAGPEVQNFDQVRAGDRVEAEYYESIALNVRAPGAAPADNEIRQAAARTAEPGEKPAGIAAQHVTVTATVTAVDKKKQTVSLKGPQGNVRKVKVRNPKNLENLAVGDQVVITYTEALAVAVRPVAAAR